MNQENDLDRRGRDAAAGLRRSVRETPRSTDAPHRTNRRPLVVVAVAVVLLVGGFVLLRTSDTSDENGVAGTGQPTRLAFDPPPAGLEVTGAFEGPIAEEGTDLGVGEVTMYRSLSASRSDHPFVAGATITSEIGLSDDGAEILTSEDRVMEVTDLGHDRFAFVIVPNQEMRVMTLWTGGVPRDEAIGLAEAATHDAAGIVAIEPAQLPDGMEDVGRVPFAVLSPAPTSFATLTSSGGIGYADEAQGRVVTVSSVIAQDGWLDAASLLVDDPQEVEVRGNPAIGGTWQGSAEPSGVVNWVEPDGTLVRMEGYGYTVDEVVAMADDLVALTDAEWRDLVATSDGQRESGADESGTTFESVGEPVEGEPPPLGDEEGLPLIESFELVQADDEGERARLWSSMGPDEVLEVDVADGERLAHRLTGLVLFGVVPPDTAKVELRFGDRTFTSAEFLHVAENGSFPLWAYAFGLPAYPGDYELIATGEDGSTITRVEHSDGSSPPTITATP